MKYRFYKKKIEGVVSKKWFIDIKFFPFNRDWLEMVAGADELLDKLSNGKDEITLEISSYPILYSTGYLEREIKGKWHEGAVYKANIVEINNSFDLESKMKSRLWLCPATLWVFWKYPKKIYYKVVSQ